MNLLISDYNWLTDKIRAEFDTPAEVYDVNRDIELIERAERFGLVTLAQQMRDDMAYPSREKTA